MSRGAAISQVRDMRYSKGRIGRVYVVRFDNDEVVVEQLKKFASKERIGVATVQIVGALKDGCIVTGPKRAVIPPQPNWTTFSDAWETVGFGTILPGKDGPQIHLHVSMGKKSRTLTGCVRKSEKVFCVLEVIVTEIRGTTALKAVDGKTGLNLLQIGRR